MHQRRSGGVEMQCWVAVGKHLALRLQEAGQGVGKRVEAGGLGVRWSTDVAKTAWVDGEDGENRHDVGLFRNDA